MGQALSVRALERRAGWPATINKLKVTVRDRFAANQLNRFANNPAEQTPSSPKTRRW
jgi:hypothetical protein